MLAAPVRLLLVAPAVFVVNLPFGYWRASVPARSPRWFLAVRRPVPAVIALRVFSGLGRQLASFPALAGAFFLAAGTPAGRYTKLRIKNQRRHASFLILRHLIF